MFIARDPCEMRSDFHIIANQLLWHIWLQYIQQQHNEMAQMDGPASEGEGRREQKESERRRSGEGFAGLQRGADAEGIRVTWKEIYSAPFLLDLLFLFVSFPRFNKWKPRMLAPLGYPLCTLTPPGFNTTKRRDEQLK